MLTPSDRLLASLPGFVALLLIFLFAMPIETGMMLSPNVAWLMTLVVASLCPLAWPRGMAFALGLLQDVIYGTPLGAQALLAMLLATLAMANMRRHPHQLFRVQWAEATGALVAMHLLLWALLRVIGHAAPPPEDMAFAGLVTSLWYPLLFVLLRPICARLPGATV